MKFISDFETTATDLAIEKNYDYVICGHIHEPKIMTKENKYGSTLYLNSGDWVETMSALAEDHDGNWQLIYYNEMDFSKKDFETDTIPITPEKDDSEIVRELKTVAFNKLNDDFNSPNFR